MSLWEKVCQTISNAWPLSRWSDVGVLVGCSGGADSVCLLRALNHLRAQFDHADGFVVAAHFNHGTRGEHSDVDAEFVEALAQQMNVNFVSQRANQSIDRDENTLRNQRLGFFESEAKRLGCRYVTVAHSADDCVETTLHHLFRGTGPSGLAGITPSRNLGEDLVIVRPMLSLRRNEIREALQSIDQPWREDASNQSSDYRRNWIRNELIPLVNSKYGEISPQVLRTIQGQLEWRSFIERTANRWLVDHLDVTHLANKTRLTIQIDSEAERSIVVAAMQKTWDRIGWSRGQMTQSHWRRLFDAISGSDLVRFNLPGDIDVSPQTNCVVLECVH